jgi:hypothetical protein
MKIYTDRRGYHNYFNATNHDKIEVYEIVGTRSYISLEDINRREKEERIFILIFLSIAYSLFLLLHLVRALRKDHTTKKTPGHNNTTTN